MRNRISGCGFKLAAICIAHSIGASASLRNTSAMPSPVGSLISFPSASAARKRGAVFTASTRSAIKRLCSLIKSVE
jgi:hypothetical protein